MKKLFSFFLLSAILLSGQAFAAPEIRGQSAILGVTDGEQIVYEKDAGKRVYPSGLTKIFTALIACDFFKNPDETVIVAENINEYYNNLELNMRLKPGEMLPMKDLLGAMLVGSANDAAYQIAVTCCKSIDAFVEEMNKKAEKMQLSGTHFTNPAGHHDENQYTTAADMLKIYREAYKNLTLREMLSTRNWTVEPTNVSKRRVLWSSNHLINTYYETKYYYVDAVSGKISTSSTGGCSIAASAYKNGINIIAIVFNSELDAGVNYSLVDAVNMFDDTFENYSPITVAKQNELVSEVKLKNSGDADHILLYTRTQLKGIIKKTDSAADIKRNLSLPDFIEAPVKTGDVAGTVEYSYNGKPMGSAELIVTEDASRSTVKFIFSKISWFFSLKAVKAVIAVIVILLIIAVCLFIYLVRVAEKKRAARKKRSK